MKNNLSSKISRRSFYLLPVVLLFCNSFNATSQKINFSGNWLINEQMSEFEGEQPSVMFKQLQVNQTKDSLIVKGFRFNDVTNSSSTITGYPFNGNLITREIGNGRIMKAFIKWSDDSNMLTRNSSYYQSETPDHLDYKTREVWSLSENGDLLTLTRTFIRDLYPPTTIKAVYEKKP